MSKRIAILFVQLVVSMALVTATPTPYPNELNGLRFYARYLAPLRPLHSDASQVKLALGSDQGVELKDWKVGILYSCKEDALTCTHGPRNDPLDTIVITPKHRVSMTHVKFPSAFAVSYGTVSEINITCRVYSDAFGLAYWVVSSESGRYKKGDLLWIQYGPAHTDE